MALALLICGLGICGLAPGIARADTRIALIIGNAAYHGSLSPLSNPVNDAELMEDSLEAVGFRVISVHDASQKEMKRAIARFGAAINEGGPDVTGLFYYAGHGLQVEGVNYLVPVSAEIAQEGDVDLESVAADSVLKQMELSGAKTSIVILDACRNNPLSRGFRSATRGLARMDTPNGSFLAYSTAPGDVAADGQGKNSPFAKALAREITKPAQAIEETFRNVRIQVMQETNQKQVPWDSSSMIAPFYFSTPSAKAVATTLPANDSKAVDVTFWESIKNSDDARDFDAYLEQFPKGNFVTLAQNRLRTLNSKSKKSTAAAAPAPAPEPQPQPAALAATAPEPDFTSPLSDGTIVLSRKVKSELDEYLAKVATMPRALGGYIWAFFYVSEDGRSSGTYTCRAELADSGDCPNSDMNTGSTGQSRQRAQRACEMRAGSKCVYLFRGNESKAAYKTLD